MANVSSINKSVISYSQKNIDITNNEKDKSDNAFQLPKDELILSLEATQVVINSQNIVSSEKNVEEPTIDEPTPEQKAMDRLNDKKNEVAFALQDLENANKNASGMADSYKQMAIAMEISRRMCKGAYVSQKDEKFLMNYDSKMYQMAKNAQMMAKQKEDQTDETLSEEDEESENSEASSIDTEVPAPEAEAPSENTSSETPPPQE